jgi:hypothetical protein
MSQSADAKDSALPALLNDASVALSKALEDEDMPEKEADEACEFLMGNLPWALPPRWTCYVPLEGTLTNRWKDRSFALLTRGRACLTHAWEARGTGLASTVSEQGWRLMGERLVQAASALEAAWTANPRDVRICIEMMRVELGQHQGKARLDTWFERGMKLAPNNRQLCLEKFEYLRPRWYGSIAEMIAFGRECTLNTNYTGGVSMMLAQAHREAARESRSRQEMEAYWRQPEVWKDVQFTFEEVLKRRPEETHFHQDYALYSAFCMQWSNVLAQAKLFPYTNYAFFGGVEKFNEMLATAQRNVGK